MGNKTKSVYNFSWKMVAGFVLAFVAGAALVVWGVYQQLNSNYVKLHVREEAEIQADVDDIYGKIDKIRSERNEIEDKTSEKYRELSNSLVMAEGERANLEEELYRAQIDFYSGMRGEAIFNSVPFIVIGVVVMLGSSAVLIANLRMNKSKIITVEEEKKTSQQ